MMQTIERGTTMTKPIELDLTIRQDNSENDYQHIEVKLDQKHKHISPDSLKNLELPLEKIDLNLGILFSGKIPLWLFAYLCLKCPSVSWISCYQPQLSGGVVINTKKPTPKIGEVIKISLPEGKIKEQVKVSREDGEKQIKYIEQNFKDNKSQQINNNSNSQKENFLQLEPIFIEADNGNQYQCLSISAINISPSCLDSLSLPNLDINREVVLWGSAPGWLYAYLANRLKNHSWVACYSVFNGVVIIKSRCSQFTSGDSFNLKPKLPCPVIIIGGPPDSGKSVLSYALEQSLIKKGYMNQVHLIRAHWDAHGDWIMETKKTSLALLLSCLYGGKPDDTNIFFQEQKKLIQKVRSNMKLLIVDFGGMPKPSDRIILDVCSHYIIISRDPEQVSKHQEFFGKGNLKPLAIIHSVLEEKLNVLNTKNCLEIEAGSWYHGKTNIPPVLLEEVEKLLVHQV